MVSKSPYFLDINVRCTYFIVDQRLLVAEPASGPAIALPVHRGGETEQEDGDEEQTDLLQGTSQQDGECCSLMNAGKMKEAVNQLEAEAQPRLLIE